MCASKGMYPRNLGCTCVGNLLVCGSSRQIRLRAMINWCFSSCDCGRDTEIGSKEPSKDLDKEKTSTELLKEVLKPSAPHRYKSPVGKIPTGSTHTCSGTCTSVDRGCYRASNGGCKCFAPPVSLFYWHKGDCGTRLPFKAKRDLAQQRQSYYLNATGEFAPSNKANAPPGPLPDLAAQLASGLLPSPCNASYVSFACGNSPDGIVHEPPQDWLGALLPEGAKESSTLPPVPETWLRIHGEEGKSQKVLKVAVD
ncbi:hypothetical protein MMC22_008711 [Lobaria immixta]|nr:hypothetical protein [Lobaria immixta]